jgi:hypothetical protein
MTMQLLTIPLTDETIKGLAQLLSIESEITYDDIKQHFTDNDLARYNALCETFTKIVDGKDNSELWSLAQPSTMLRATLDGIHALRQRYGFLKGEWFFKVWRIDNNVCEIMCW